MYTYTYINVVSMVKMISVSDEVYEMLTKRKGKASYSEVIKSSLETGKGDISKFFGILKISDVRAKEWKRQIKEARETGWPADR